MTDSNEISRLLDEPPSYTCVDCDSGDLTREAARWHAHHEGHYVVMIEESDTE